MEPNPKPMESTINENDQMLVSGAQINSRENEAVSISTSVTRQQPSSTRTTPDPEPRISVSQVTRPATTREGMPRRRIQWTNEMNEYVIKSYYRVTQCETIRTGYRQQLHHEFSTNFPNLNLTEQNIADRRAAIFRLNLVPENVRARIRDEINTELQQHTTVHEEYEPTEHPTIDNPPVINSVATPNNTNFLSQNRSTLQDELTNVLEESLIKYKGLDIESRPMLPKQKHSNRLTYITNLMNTEILPQHTNKIESYLDLNLYMYCCATAIITANGGKIKSPNALKSIPKQPSWEIRLNRKIKELRTDAGIVSAYIRLKTRKLRRKFQVLKKKHRVHSRYDNVNQTPEEIFDTIKQKLTMYAQRLRRYKKSQKRQQDNRLFNTNPKLFFQKCKNSGVDEATDTLPDRNSFENFWSNIWSKEQQHNVTPAWLKKIENSAANITTTPTDEITESTIAECIRKLKNWKATGKDMIHNFWIKKLSNLHFIIRRFFNTFLNHPSEIPNSFCEGITYLKPKENNTVNPAKFRPITCLNTFYKLFTSCLASIIENHCNINNILAEQQKGCKKGSLGCKEQLIIDSVITN